MKKYTTQEHKIICYKCGKEIEGFTGVFWEKKLGRKARLAHINCQPEQEQVKEIAQNE